MSTATIVNSVPANYRPPAVLTDTTQIAQVAGNTIVLPSPGTGEDIIKGKLTAIDRVDMTQALAGTTWDHNMATIGNYMTTNRTGAGLVVKVGNKVVALFTDGVPGNDITPFLIAH